MITFHDPPAHHVMGSELGLAHGLSSRDLNYVTISRCMIIDNAERVYLILVTRRRIILFPRLIAHCPNVGIKINWPENEDALALYTLLSLQPASVLCALLIFKICPLSNGLNSWLLMLSLDPSSLVLRAIEATEL